MGLGISKHYSSCNFHPMSIKLHEDNSHEGIHSVTFLASRPGFKTFVALVRGKYRLLLFLAICQTLKVHGTLKINYLRYVASIHRAMLVSSGKVSSTLGLLFFTQL